MSKYQNVTDAPAAMPHEDRQFLHTRTAGIDVPLLQSVVTAVFVGLSVLTIALVFDVLDPWKPTAISMAFALAGWWGYSLLRWTRLTERERAIVQTQSVDDDGDPATPRIIRVQLDRVTDAGHYQQTAIFDLPATEEQLAAMAEGLLNQNRPFSEREWAGAGNPFSVNGFRSLRSEMIKRGLLALRSDKDPRQGYGLTPDGEAVLREFLP